MGEESEERRKDLSGDDVEARASGSAESVWGDAEDLTALTVEELRELLVRFDEEEKVVSYRRRVLQGRIDVIRAEIVRRGEAALSPEDLVRILMGDVDGGKEKGAGGGDPAGGT